MSADLSLLLVDIIRSTKENVEIGNWKTGPVTQSKFPLTRRKLSLGRGWKWRIMTFNAREQLFVVLVALNEEKEYYRATLAMKHKDTLKVICCHELHTDHLNWHCHLIRGNVHETFPGVSRDKEHMSAWPIFTKSECAVPFNVTEDSALTIAAERFRITKREGFL